MPETHVISKAAFSRLLGVSKPRVSQYVAMGMPVRIDGRLDLAVAVAWVRDNIGPAYRPTGGQDIELSAEDLERICGG